MAIPKKIHYIWFGGKELPRASVAFLKTWEEILPDYEIIRWDESNFDVNQHPWLKEAYDNKKYGFASDYARLKVLYDHGGIYFDADIKVKKSFDQFLDLDFFIGHMDNATLATSVIGAKKHSEIIAAMLTAYDEGKAIIGQQNNFWTTQFFLDYFDNFRLTGKTQEIEPNVWAFRKEYFDRPTKVKTRGFSTHHYFGTWMNKNPNRIVRFGILEMPIAKVAQVVSLLMSPFYKIHKKHMKEYRKNKKNT